MEIDDSCALAETELLYHTPDRAGDVRVVVVALLWGIHGPAYTERDADGWWLDREGLVAVVLIQSA